MRARIVSLLLVLAMLTALFCSCFDNRTDEEKIYDRLDAFLEAYNGGDFDGVLECMSKKTRSAFEGVANLFGVDTGYSLGDIFGVSVYGASEGDLLDAVVLDVIIEGESAIVRVEMTYSDKIHTTTDKVKFTMVKEDGDWFVSDLEDHVLSHATLTKRMNAMDEEGSLTLKNGEKEAEKWLDVLNTVLVRNDEDELSLGIISLYYDQAGKAYLFEFGHDADAQRAVSGFELLYASGEIAVEDWRITREGRAVLLGEQHIVERLITIEFD